MTNGETFELRGATILSARHIKDGPGWELYKIGIDKPKWEKTSLTYFLRPEGIQPEVGARFDLTIVKEKRDRFTNYRIKSLDPVSELEPEPEPEPPDSIGADGDALRTKSICYSYAKDLLIACMQTTDSPDFLVLVDMIAKGGEKLYRALNGEIPSEAPSAPQEKTSPPGKEKAKGKTQKSLPGASQTGLEEPTQEPTGRIQADDETPF